MTTPSAILSLMQAWVAKVSSRSYLAACTGVVVVVLALTGIGTVPHEPYRLTALNPFVKSEVYDVNTFQESPLLPLIANLLRLTEPLAFGALCLLFAALALVLMAAWARRQLGAAVGVVLFALVVSHPAILVLLSWVGTPDSITFLLAACLLFVSHPLALLSIGLIGGFNHPLILFVAPAVLILRWLSREGGIGPRHFVACIAGLIAGTVGVHVFLNAYGIGVFGRLEYLRTLTLAGWIEHNLSNLPAALYSLNGISWLTIALCVPCCYHLDRRYYRAFLVSQAVFLGLMFFSIDTTRVFALVSWPTIAHCAVHSLRLAQMNGASEFGRELKSALTSLALLGIFGPRFYVWDGVIYGPPMAESYLALARAVRDSLGGS